MHYGRSVPDGYLPVFRVPTVENARCLIVLCCSTNLEGSYIASELAKDQTLENLDKFSKRLADAWEMIK